MKKLNDLIAVITGDVVNSSKGDVTRWISALKETLNQYGTEPENWEIYRGDSFQLSLTPEKAMIAAFHIKAALKQLKLYDVRIAIGLGKEKYSSPKISEANGSAYINSGGCFESLKKQTLAIKSNSNAFDLPLNIMIRLSLLTTNHWTPTASEVIKMAIEYPNKTQKDLADLLNRSQSSVSEALKRGGFEELMLLNDYYKKSLSNI